MSDPTPMELNATQKPRGKDRMEEEKRRRNNKYYNCGKTGYFSTHCATKKSYFTRKMYRVAEATVSEDLHEEGSGKEDPQE
jgi:hypothetical protein